MSSSKTRQRKLERQRYERKLVRMAQQQRRKRQVQAGVGAFLALALMVLGGLWLGGVFDPDPAPPPEADRCTWLPRDPAEDPNRTDVGTPPANPAETGVRTVSLDLDAGDSGAGQVEFQIDVAADPCAAASLEHLAAQGFYDGTTCHQLVDGALRCGDPSGTGEGGPAYGFWGENVPPPPTAEDPDAAPPVNYPAGTVALWDTAGENGSQFLIFYDDFAPENPTYPLLGTVTSGLDVVQEIGKAGGTEQDPAVPVEDVELATLTVTDPAAGQPSPTAPASQ